MGIIAEPIDVIAKFTAKQKLTPIKLLYVNDAGKDAEVIVDQILKTKGILEVGFKTRIYRCQSKIGSADRRFERKYIPDKCSWQFLKM